MTDLISRPARATASAAVPPGRPLSGSAAVGGLVAAGIGLVLCMALALTGWFLADAGGHGDTTDALRVGANGWLLGQGTRLTVAGMPIGVAPLTLTMMLALVAFRCGRWSARNAVEVDDDGTLAGGVAIFAAAYVSIGVLVAVLFSTGSVPRTVLGTLLLAGIAGGLGLAAGTGRLDAWIDRAPGWAREVAVAALSGALLLVAASAVLVCVALLLSFDEAATVISGLGLSTGDAVAYTVVVALLAPNTVLFGSAYLLGPGFALGTGTTVSPTAVSLGVVPAYPVLAALPGDGPTPGWLVGLLAVPVLAAAIGVGLSLSRSRSRSGGGADQVTPYDVAAIRGAGSGFGAGLLITVAIALAGGPMGTGRLADIGAPTAQVLVFATGLMSAGGVLGAVATTWWRRRRR